MKLRTDERIKIVNGYDKDSFTYIPIIVIGAGESGIATACQLKAQLGFDQFRVYDRQSGFGGTWWINRYPGVACDVPTPYYSFSWRPFREATELYPSGPELIRYFQRVASEYGVVDKFNLNTDVTELRWLPQEKQWEAKLRYMAHGTGDLSKYDRERLIAEKGEGAVYLGSETIRAKIAISCVGGLVEPKDVPSDVKGWDTFKGDMLHTARWKPDIDLEGKDVVVVGTGASAAQAVPRLTSAPYNAKSVTQVMRSPPWVSPRVAEPGGKKRYAETAPWVFTTFPGLHRAFRLFIAYKLESDWFKLFGDSERNARNREHEEAVGLRFMRKTTPERYHEMLTPNFSIGCKRRLWNGDWYKGFNDPKIQLTTQRLVEVGEDSVTLAPGGLFPDREDDKRGESGITLHADAIVLANGFETTKWLHPIEVIGKHGRSLQDVWEERGGAQAYNGVAMDGFPNLFIIFGPNTATGHQSVILASENMVNYSIKFISKILSGDAETAEVTKEAEIEWAQRQQRELQHRVFHIGGCSSWYVDPKTGWNSTVYSRSQIDHTLRCMFPVWSHWNIELTTKGLTKKRVGQALKTLVTFALIVGVYRFRQSKMKLKNIPAIAKMAFKMSLMGLLGKVVEQAESLQESLF